MNANDDQPPYIISNEHYLQILLEYLPRELYAIVRLTSKSFNRIDVVREMLNRGADINASMDDGRNSLMTASQYGRVDVVRELLDRGADINAVDSKGSNSLMIASRDAHIEVVRELTSRGAESIN